LSVLQTDSGNEAMLRDLQVLTCSYQKGNYYLLPVVVLDMGVGRNYWEVGELEQVTQWLQAHFDILKKRKVG